MCQYRDKTLVIFLIQKCPKPAGWISPLQTDLLHLVLQCLLWLIMWDSTHQLSTSNIFLQYDRIHQQKGHTGFHSLIGYCMVWPLWSTVSLRTSVLSTSNFKGLTLSFLWCFLPEKPSGVIPPTCGVVDIFNILSCPDWPKSYCINYLLFNLFPQPLQKYRWVLPLYSLIGLWYILHPCPLKLYTPKDLMCQAIKSV